jgi:glycerophosphoryl diester phosphodiesterase
VLVSLRKLQSAGGPRIWVNTLWDSLCAGHTDERGYNGDPAGSWGWCLERGATMIQTDRPVELIRYLEKKNRRCL